MGVLLLALYRFVLVASFSKLDGTGAIQFANRLKLIMRYPLRKANQLKLTTHTEQPNEAGAIQGCKNFWNCGRRDLQRETTSDAVQANSNPFLIHTQTRLLSSQLLRCDPPRSRFLGVFLFQPRSP